MIRKLLFLFACVLTTVGAWAEATVTYTTASNEHKATITLSAEGELSAAISGLQEGLKTVKIVGALNSDDVAALANLNVEAIDLAEATGFTIFANTHVKHVVLPNGWDKAKVNAAAIALASNLESAASISTKSAGNRTVYLYTYNGQQYRYTGEVTGTGTEDDPYTFSTNIDVPVTLDPEHTSYTYFDNGENKPYEGTVVLVNNGTSYGVSDGATVVELTATPNTYTYNSGTSIYTGPVANVNDVLYGNVDYTDTKAVSSYASAYTYMHDYTTFLAPAGAKVFADAYNSYIYIGGEDKALSNLASGYVYDNNPSYVYPADRATRTNGYVYGNVGGEQVTLDSRETLVNGSTPWTGIWRYDGQKYYVSSNDPVALTYGYKYVIDDNGQKIYTGKTRTDGVNTYGNTGTEVELASASGWAYDNEGSKVVYTGYKRSEILDDVTTYYGNTGTEKTLTYNEGFCYNDGTVHQYSGKMAKVDDVYYGYSSNNTSTNLSKLENAYTYEKWGSTYATNDASKISDNKYYEDEWNSYDVTGPTTVYVKEGNIVWSGKVYVTYTDGVAGEDYTGYDYGTEYTLSQGYYTYDGSNIYSGKIYNNDPLIGYVNGEEKVVEAYDYYTYNAGANIYTGELYGESPIVGYVDGSEKALTYEQVYTYMEGEVETLYPSGNHIYNRNAYPNEDVKVGIIGGYEWSDNVSVSSVKTYTDGEGTHDYTGNVYGEENNIGFVGGQEKQLTAVENIKYVTETLQVYTDAVSTDGNYGHVGGTKYTATAPTQPSYNCYTDNNGELVVYEGKVFKDNEDNDVALVGGTEYQLACGTVYTYGEPATIYTGMRTLDNTKGISSGETFQLTAQYSYTYVDPTTSETNTIKSPTALTTTPVPATFTTTETDTEDIPGGDQVLTAYVAKAGTLAKTLQHMSQLSSSWSDYNKNDEDTPWYWYCTQEGGYGYNCLKVTDAIISGNLLAVDISCGGSVIDENNHYASEGGKSRATLNTNNSAHLKYIDLSDAKFGEGDNYHPEDMTLVSLCHNKLETVILPTDASQTTIPDNCLNTAQSITKLCIPFNFQYIGEAAFLNSTIKKFTTTSPYEQVVNEGEANEHRYAIGAELDVDELEDHSSEYNSWTLPPFLKEIKTLSFQTNWSQLCTDVYIFANPAPKCELNAFSEGMYTGWGGFEGNEAHPIQRGNYKNGVIYFTILHYPSGLTDFERMHYTDITRKYTFMDETGATDDDGNVYYWPAMNQFYRAYDQAMCGVTWEAWEASRDWNDYSQTSGFWDPVGIYKTQSDGQTDSQSHLNIANLASYDEAAMTAAACTYSAKGGYQSGVVYDYAYAGWHQFVLVGATNFVEGPGKTYWNFSSFKENDWYTICVPFDLRKSDLLRIFGAKMDSEKEVKVGGVAITEDKYPDVRTLEGVTRDNQNLRIFLSLSQDLIEKPLQYESDGRVKVDVSGDKIQPVYGTYSDADPVIIEHDHPYYIKPVLPDEDMDLANAGSRVLEYDPFNYTSDHYAVPNLTTYVYATNAARTKYITKADVEKGTDVSEASYKYYFIGNYIAQNMPQYTYYVGKSSAGPHKMFRNTKTNRAWNAYTCVVGGVANTGSVVAKTGTDSQGGVTNAMVQFLADEDFTFGYSTAGAKTALGFGYLISMPEEDGTSTGVMIPNADGSMSYYRDNTPVYNINGQKVGNSIHNLPKGLYIINGKKFTVK